MHVELWVYESHLRAHSLQQVISEGWMAQVWHVIIDKKHAVILNMYITSKYGFCNNRLSVSVCASLHYKSSFSLLNGAEKNIEIALQRHSNILTSIL